MLDAKGIPMIVARTLIRPPSSQLGPITAGERKSVMSSSPMAGKYDTTIDRESASEILAKRAAAAAEAAEKAEAEEERLEAEEREFKAARRYSGSGTKGRSTSRRRTVDNSWTGAIATVVAKELKGTTGKRSVRGILGGLFKGR
jgi:hypothetical protein